MAPVTMTSALERLPGLGKILFESNPIGAGDLLLLHSVSGRNAVPVDIGRVLSVARIEQVLCNGALSGRLYRRHLLPVTGMDCLVMPSTSPANAAVPLEQLIAVWGEALRGHMRTP